MTRRVIVIFVGTVAMLVLSAAVRAQETGQSGAPSQPPKGHIVPAKVIHQVLPKYPKSAKKAGISGMVVLKAVVTKDGSVKDLEYVSGPEELTDAAIKAVMKWKYEPMLLNGKPVDVSTTISVNFVM